MPPMTAVMSPVPKRYLRMRPRYRGRPLGRRPLTADATRMLAAGSAAGTVSLEVPGVRSTRGQGRVRRRRQPASGGPHDRRRRRRTPGGVRPAAWSPRSSRSCRRPTAPGSAGPASPTSSSSRSSSRARCSCPVTLSAEDVELYYEGFSNDTIWPLYHDVIAEPRYRRVWWDAYVRVNRRFAEAAAAAAEDGATVWVQDYQLQLVPRMLRDLRPDLMIGYFHHIPFPAYGLYSQLPWRRQVLEGLLGADVIGFQRVADAGNFARAVRRQLRYETKASGITVPEADGTTRRSLAQGVPDLDRRVVVHRAGAARRRQERAPREIRESLGNPKRIFLGVDRLDYTKGIRHRLKAYGELLDRGEARASRTSRSCRSRAPAASASRPTSSCATRSS